MVFCIINQGKRPKFLESLIISFYNRYFVIFLCLIGVDKKLKGENMASITVREYNSESGVVLGSVSTLNFGKITAGTHSRVKVIDIAFGEVTLVGNIKLGIISNGGLTVNNSPTDIGSDGSAGNGYFGIESTAAFDSTKASSPLSRHFPGTNTSITAGDTNNVSIGARSDTISYYIYIDIEIGATNINTINGAYKVFFDYS